MRSPRSPSDAPPLRRRPSRLLGVAAALLILPAAAHAQLAPDGSAFDAEHAFQGYLSFWSRDADINGDAVARFYAPRVVYYGKNWSRGDVLADKAAYIRHWPQRDYREVPGSLNASCNPGRTLCRITADMAWRRAAPGHPAVAGRSRLTFEFVKSEGAFKIARESARTL